jgi:hypothetical protein
MYFSYKGFLFKELSWLCDLDLWPWKSIGFQILLRTKYVPSLVKIHWRMLILERSQGCDGRTVALLLLYPFATQHPSMDFDQTWYILSPQENLEPYWFQGHMSKIKVTGSNFYRITSRSKQNKGKAWRIPSPKNFTRWPWPLTLKINSVPDSLKC